MEPEGKGARGCRPRNFGNCSGKSSRNCRRARPPGTEDAPAGAQGAGKPGEGAETGRRLPEDIPSSGGQGQVLFAEDRPLLPTPRITEGYAKVTVSPDEMEAYVEVVPWTVTRYRLVEEGGAGREQFRLEEETDFFCPADYEDILTLLEQAGVRYGIDHARIRKLVSKPRYGTFVVAAGLPPQEPTDESVEFFFPRDAAAGEGNGHRGSVRVFSIDPGTTLAAKRPGKPGKPGMSVTGRALPPRPPRRVRLVAGSGTELAPDGDTVMARIAGRPCVRERDGAYVFTINPVLVHSGDIAVATGGIHFRGDLEVHGNILDGASVYASGNARIHGFASYARISAGGSLSIEGNVFACRLRAGCPAAYLMRGAGPLLSEVASNLQALAELAGTLAAHPAVQERQVPVGTLLLNLMEYKFPNLGRLVARLCDTIRNTPGLSRSTLTLLHELGQFFPAWKVLILYW